MFSKYFKKQKSKSLDFKDSDNLAPELISELKSMVEIAYEYAGFNDDEIDEVYVFCSNEAGRYSSFFFGAYNQIIQRHKLNEILKKKIDDSPNMQAQAIRICLSNLKNINSYCENTKKEIPMRLYCSFKIETGKLKCDLEYDKKLKDFEITEHDLEDNWIEKLKLDMI